MQRLVKANTVRQRVTALPNKFSLFINVINVLLLLSYVMAHLSVS